MGHPVRSPIGRQSHGMSHRMPHGNIYLVVCPMPRVPQDERHLMGHLIIHPGPSQYSSHGTPHGMNGSPWAWDDMSHGVFHGMNNLSWTIPWDIACGLYEIMTWTTSHGRSHGTSCAGCMRPMGWTTHEHEMQCPMGYLQG